MWNLCDGWILMTNCAFESLRYLHSPEGFHIFTLKTLPYKLDMIVQFPQFHHSATGKQKELEFKVTLQEHL